MPARNIHSLSLALSPASNDDAINNPPRTIKTTPSATDTTAGSPPNKACRMDMDDCRSMASSLGIQSFDRQHQNPSTIFRQGLITPTTPCYHHEGNTNNDSKGGSSGSPRPAAAASLSALTNAMSMSAIDSPPDEEDIGFSLEEFAKSYVPLSHLPTPPPSAACSVDLHAEREVGGHLVEAEFWGPAKYLVSMIPRNAFREPPSVTMMAVILQNANVRLSVVSLAGCILDCLSDQFVKLWRRRCCDAADGAEAELGEVLAVAALAISMKFLEDSAYTNRLWTHNICSDIFPLKAFNLTERLVLHDIDYCLHGISSPEQIGECSDRLKQFTAEAAGFRPHQQQKQKKMDEPAGYFEARTAWF